MSHELWDLLSELSCSTFHYFGPKGPCEPPPASASEGGDENSQRWHGLWQRDP